LQELQVAPRYRSRSRNPHPDLFHFAIPPLACPNPRRLWHTPRKITTPSLVPSLRARSQVALENALVREVALRIAWGKPHPTAALYCASGKDVKDLNDLKD